MPALPVTTIVLPGVTSLLFAAGPLNLPPLLGLMDASEKLIGLVALIGGLLLAAVIVATVLYFQSKQRQMWHETARIALEKGQPLPPWPKPGEELEFMPPPGTSLAEWEAVRRAREQRGSLKGGLIAIAVGVGLYILMGRQGGGLVGAIPALIGVALIVHVLIERLSAGPQGK